SDVRLTGAIDGIEECDETLLDGFGNGFRERAALNIAMADQVLVGRVRPFEDVARALEHGEEGRSLLEETGEPFALLLQLVVGQDGLGSFSTDHECAADGAGGIAN